MPIEPVGPTETTRLKGSEAGTSRADRYAALFEAPLADESLQAFGNRGGEELESTSRGAGAPGEPASPEIMPPAVEILETGRGARLAAMDPSASDVDSGLAPGLPDLVADAGSGATDIAPAVSPRSDVGHARFQPNNANVEPNLPDPASRDLVASSDLQRGLVSAADPDSALAASNVNRPVAAFISAPIFAAAVPMQIDAPLGPRSQDLAGPEFLQMAAFRPMTAGSLHDLHPPQFMPAPERAQALMPEGPRAAPDASAGSEPSWNPSALRPEPPQAPPIGQPLLSSLVLLPLAIRERMRPPMPEAEDAETAPPLRTAHPDPRRQFDRRHRRMARGFRRRVVAATAMAQMRAAASRLTSIGRHLREIGGARLTTELPRLLLSRSIRICRALLRRLRPSFPDL